MAALIPAFKIGRVSVIGEVVMTVYASLDHQSTEISQKDAESVRLCDGAFRGLDLKRCQWGQRLKQGV
jgi:hypothetical protein